MSEADMPQWWEWTDTDGWSVTGWASVEVWRNGKACRVFATVADRDAKRDALLAVAQVSGKVTS